MKYRFILLFLLISISPLYAYIDPSTGSLIFSTIIGLTAAVVFSVKGFFYTLLAKLSGRAVSGSNDFSGKLVIFSEGKNYWQVFKPVIDELVKRNKEFVYITAGKDDPCLDIESNLIDKHSFSSINHALVFLNTMKADVCVMTTPQLNILTLKRSKYVRHYCHLFHAPSDIHTYKKFSLDYYDSALCVNDFHLKSINQLDIDRNSRKKQIFKTGCTYYDLKEISYNSDADSILVAPAWGDRSYLSVCGEEIIDNLLENNYKVIFRPHPQAWTSEKELTERIVFKYSSNNLFSIDKSPDNSESLSKAKVLICDISGIIYDFAFLKRRPVITVDIDWNKGGYEDSDIEHRDSAYELLEDTGKLITSEEAENISDIIEEVGEFEISDDIINKHIYNFRCAGKTAAEQIMSLCGSGE